MLADPTLELRDSNGELVRSNNNWKESQQAEIQATGIPPTERPRVRCRRDTSAGALHRRCPGVNGTTGVGLVEVYNLQ